MQEVGSIVATARAIIIFFIVRMFLNSNYLRVGEHASLPFVLFSVEPSDIHESHKELVPVVFVFALFDEGGATIRKLIGSQ